MKKVLLFAAAAATLFAGCAKDGVNNGVDEVKYGTISIKVAGAGVNTRMNAGSQITLNDETVDVTWNGGYAFVLDGSGAILGKKALGATATTTAERIPGTYANTVKVLVIGNLPGSVTAASVDALTNLSGIKTLVANISTQNDYQTVTLANIDSDGTLDINDCTAVTAKTGGTATEFEAAPVVSPVVSRIELTKIDASTTPTAGDDNEQSIVTAFTVAGVYLTDYYPQFNVAGGFEGSIYKQEEQGDETVFTSVLADYRDEVAGVTGGIAKVGSEAPYTVGASTAAVLPGTRVWAYNVAANTMPNIIIKLSNITVTDLTSGTEETVSGDRYVRIKTLKYPNPYNTNPALAGQAITSLLRGNVYRLSTVGFPADKMSVDIPVDQKVSIDVEVGIQNWQLVSVEGGL